MTATAASIHKGVLDPSLDAIAENLRQANLIANNKAGIDSLAEVLIALDRAALTERQHQLARQGLALVRDLAASNTVERDCERKVAGAADTLVTGLRRVERRAQPPAEWSVKGLARKLRAPLADLCNPVIVGERRDEALRLVREVVEDAPSGLLLSAGLRHELGVAKTTVLHELVARFAPKATA